MYKVLQSFAGSSKLPLYLVVIILCYLSSSFDAYASSRAPAARAPLQSSPKAPVSREETHKIGETKWEMYVRADVGYVTAQGGDLRRASQWLRETNFEDTASFSLGLGWKRGSLRVDITGDYTKIYGFNARYNAGGANTNALVTGNVTALTVLANAYWDIGYWKGITPYVGAGIGTTYLGIPDYVALGGGVNPEDGDQINFSYALMAGLAIKWHPNIWLDLGYRYLYLGDSQTGVDGNNIKTHLFDQDQHELRFGVRVVLD